MRNYMGHGQYLVYSSKSSIFEECIICFPFFRNIAHVIVFWRVYYRFPNPSSISNKNRCLEYYFPLRLNLVVAHIYRILQVFMGYQLTIVSLDRPTTAHFLYIATRLGPRGAPSSSDWSDDDQRCSQGLRCVASYGLIFTKLQMDLDH